MIGTLLNEALSLRENRRIKAALHMARLPIIQALDGYDFSFQPSLDRNRILALAGLTSSIGLRSCICWGVRAPGKAILPPLSPSKP